MLEHLIAGDGAAKGTIVDYDEVYAAWGLFDDVIAKVDTDAHLTQYDMGSAGPSTSTIF